MRRKVVRPGLFVLCLLLLSGCAASGPLPPPPVHPNGQGLWKILNDQCVPDQVQHHDPAPCAQVSSGFVILKDLEGASQYLLMPTERITGIEDPKLLDGGGENYFAEAWDARGFFEARRGGAVARDDISIAVNSIYGRSQDQLHLHIDCLAGTVKTALRQHAAEIGPDWSRRGFVLAGESYRIRRLDGATLGSTDPFRLLTELPGAKGSMAAWTLVLAGTTTADGRPGFYLMAAKADPAAGTRGSGELLQDHECKGVAGGPLGAWDQSKSRSAR